MSKKFGLYSSVNPEKISLTLKSLIPLVLALLPLFGVINIGENDLVMLTDQIIAVISGGLFIYGFVRKFIK